ncbi:cytochrome P450 4C1-like isoform X1 [Ischnura elegans]|uniref:cytochrome P450 4C1-like isoform X1 n=1 Tax=Ischnura elegans TaxID=197161 RepID=UPI001ED87EA5|nr:cytochrome P450 4C1-like isoform X1 [Ischnura elegans]
MYLLPVLWSVMLFCITLPILSKLKAWFRVFLMSKRLPGPKGHPLLGHAAEFASKEKFFESAKEWAKEFSMHKTFILFHPLILLHSPETVQVVLRGNRHSEKGFIYKGLRALLGEGLITSKGSKWHAHRKLITPTFHFNILESFVDVFVKRTNQMMDRLKEKAGGEVFDICPYTQKLTLDFICETAMGTPVNAQNNQRLQIVSAIHKLEEIGIYRMIRPWLLSDWLFKFTKMGKEQDKYKNILHSFTNKVITERKEFVRNRSMEKAMGMNEEDTGATGEGGHLQSCDEGLQPLKSTTSEKFEDKIAKKKKAIFMDLLIEYSENGRLLTDKDIREEVNTFMFAGQNTTQLAINYCLFLLGNHPKIQDRAYEELESIFGSSDRDPTTADLRDMRYLEQCIKEALRLYPSVPVIARTLTHDETIGKHTLPAGADVLILPYVLHRNPDQFPDPETFNPDNFLPERVKNRHPYSYIPFSAGPRNCIGQKFAVLAEKTALSSILRRYRIESLHSQDDLVVVPNTVLVPKKGIRLRLIPRTTAEADSERAAK